MSLMFNQICINEEMLSKLTSFKYIYIYMYVCAFMCIFLGVIAYMNVCVYKYVYIKNSFHSIKLYTLSEGLLSFA